MPSRFRRSAPVTHPYHSRAERHIVSPRRVGRSLTFPSAPLVELAARAGFDAVHLDGEHGAFTPESVDLMCRVANGYGMSVTARVPDVAASTINLWLDRGVH